jgi:hypothetical protein
VGLRSLVVRDARACGECQCVILVVMRDRVVCVGVRGAWCVVRVRGAWCVVRGAWYVVRGTWCVVRGAWCVVRGAWYVVRGAWCACRCVGGFPPSLFLVFSLPLVARSRTHPSHSPSACTEYYFSKIQN